MGKIEYVVYYIDIEKPTDMCTREFLKITCHSSHLVCNYTCTKLAFSMIWEIPPFEPMHVTRRLYINVPFPIY